MKIEALRTPVTRFEGLPGYGFAPHYRDDLPRCVGLRLHYLDEGPRNGRVALCLHGQPTWSYLYRRMIPGLVAAGYDQMFYTLAALAAGKTTALFYTGGTEQRGPQNINGGHNYMAKATVKELALRLGQQVPLAVVIWRAGGLKVVSVQGR